MVDWARRLYVPSVEGRVIFFSYTPEEVSVKLEIDAVLPVGEISVAVTV